MMNARMNYGLAGRLLVADNGLSVLSFLAKAKAYAEETGLPSPSMDYHKEDGDRIKLSFTSEKPLDLLPLHAYLSELADSLQAELICSVYEPTPAADENNDAANAA